MTKKWDAGSLIGTSSAYWRGCTLQAAVRLEVFTVLGKQQKSLESISKTIKSDQRGTEFLLNGLSGMELLEKSGQSYQNSPGTYELLSKDSPRYIGHIILHHHHILDGWAQLDRAVRTGAPIDKRSYGEETERESFLMGMFNLAMGTAPVLAGAIDLSGKNRLLDLGGGPGTFAIHFCMANPGLQGVVFDRSTTEPFMRKTVASFDLSERIDFLSGDFNQDKFGAESFDVAWLSHVLHSNGPEECENIVRKVYEVLEPGGLILVHDFILADTKDSPEFGTLFSLNMLINNPNGRSYSAAEITAMLEKAGFSDCSLIDPGTPNQSLVMAASKL